MSSKFLRHSWLAIAAPFFAGSILRAADSHWGSAKVLCGVGLALVSVELIMVLRVRLRSPFYRLRNFRSQQFEAAAEVNRYQAMVSGYAARIVSDCLDFVQLLDKEENALAHDTALISDIGTKRRIRQHIKQQEKSLCELLSEFRGFFYAPD